MTDKNQEDLNSSIAFEQLSMVHPFMAIANNNKRTMVAKRLKYWNTVLLLACLTYVLLTSLCRFSAAVKNANILLLSNVFVNHDGVSGVNGKQSVQYLVPLLFTRLLSHFSNSELIFSREKNYTRT